MKEAGAGQDRADGNAGALSPEIPALQMIDASRIPTRLLLGQSDVAEDVLRMIGLVSCSANGNSAPPEASAEPELLWPRWADRLEATGEIGVVRCWQYNCEVQAPLSVDTTPRPRTEEEVWELATPERFDEYQRTGGASASMMDHYYDKLLRVARPPPALVRNSYLEAEMAKQAAPLVRVCLEFGATGSVPLGTIREMAVRTDLAGG
ncbi:unnamed protein product [Prorocentrum cordatum]|uniref:Uncharacterized protein n=1 Tax=Prorocentrum cordatum TaxID=2364126 RepID=A0ABN9QTX0_9DINO|nr:unnamed protein product [Polarella glacialis]